DVDGDRGQLIIAAHRVEELSGTISFEEGWALLWSLVGPPRDAASVRAALGPARVAAFEHLGRMGDAFERPDGMDALRTAMSHLTIERDSNIELTAAMTVFAAAWGASGKGGLRCRRIPISGTQRISCEWLRGARRRAPRDWRA